MAAGALTSDLSHALQQSLRVGKRAHSETGLDEVARSLFGAALEASQAHIGSARAANALVIGAGAMSGLVVAGLHKEGVNHLTVLNRTIEKAERLIAEVGGRARKLTPRTLAEEIADADLIISCTGARGVVVTRDDIVAGLSQSSKSAANKAFIDFALPHDIDPSVREFEHVALFGLGEIRNLLTSSANERDAAVVETVEAVRAIIAEEADKLESGAKERAVAPTVTALRTHAKDVIAAETERLEKKIGESVDEKVFAEIRKSAHRVAEKLIHTPTVKVKELAVSDSDVDYAQALIQLFDLPTIKVAHAKATPETKVAKASSPEHIEADGLRPVADHTLDVVEPEHPTGRTIRLGTRRSQLARSQSTAIAHQIAALTGWRVEIVEVVTEGDVNMSPLAGFGGTGVFVSAVRQALHQGQIDVAVHSLKDLPTTPEPGIQLAADPAPRRSRRRPHRPRRPRPERASPARRRRRHRFAEARRPGARRPPRHRGPRGPRQRRHPHRPCPRRPPRCRRPRRAGVRRIGRLAEATDLLDFDTMLPAPGQGALAIETRGADSPFTQDEELMAGDVAIRTALRRLHDEATDLAVTCERAILSRAEAGCSAPIGALATIEGDEVVVTAMMADDDGTIARTRMSAPPPVVDGDLSSRDDEALKVAGKEIARVADELGTAAAEDLLRRLDIDPAQSSDHLTPVKAAAQSSSQGRA